MTVPQTRKLPTTLHCTSLNVSLVLVTEEPPTHCGKISKLVETQRKHFVTIEWPSSGASARPRPWEPSKCTGSYTCARGSRRCRGCPTASPARPSSPRSLRAAVRVGPTLGAVWGGTARMGRQDVSWSPRLGYRTITVRKFMQVGGSWDGSLPPDIPVLFLGPLT